MATRRECRNSLWLSSLYAAGRGSASSSDFRVTFNDSIRLSVTVSLTGTKSAAGLMRIAGHNDGAALVDLPIPPTTEA